LILRIQPPHGPALPGRTNAVLLPLTFKQNA
jgi:hypothetical protein